MSGIYEKKSFIGTPDFRMVMKNSTQNTYYVIKKSKIAKIRVCLSHSSVETSAESPHTSLTTLLKIIISINILKLRCHCLMHVQKITVTLYLHNL